MKLLNQIRRFIAYFDMRCLEAQLHEQNRAIEYVRDYDTLRDIIDARNDTRRKLTMARIIYHNTFPPGDRRTWKIA